jgi:hypothetical protein
MNILDPIFYCTLFYDFRPVISPGILTNKAGTWKKRTYLELLKRDSNVSWLTRKISSSATNLLVLADSSPPQWWERHVVCTGLHPVCCQYSCLRIHSRLWFLARELICGPWKRRWDMRSLLALNCSPATLHIGSSHQISNSLLGQRWWPTHRYNFFGVEHQHMPFFQIKTDSQKCA